ncbi:YwqG family protein [Sporosarcina limicola]|uniref:Uncharacterized protein YwqG n=1 Tax=Sporosarcina limicola TaxID=34101 RepID=A0A927MLR3_9BACL|nr:YwqG family protein [Sporosarcina limicola]MBE1556690.1 uncharacterized protein YwqG [Sporosarcina limicola]
MQTLNLLLEKYSLQHKQEELVKVAASSIGMKKEFVKEQEILIGSSKFGGLPDLPSHFSFPKLQERYLSFLGQVNLEEVTFYDKNNELPKTGILYFFYDVIEQPWGMEKEEKDGFKVLYFEGNSNGLKRTSYPEKTEDYSPLPVFKIEFKDIWTFPEDPKGIELDDNERERYFEFRDSNMQMVAGSENDEISSDSMHYMLGEPFNVQNDVFEEIIYYANEEKLDWDSKEIMDKSDEMVLLFQMDSDDDLEVMWGDCGMLYFCINKKDLAEKRFDRTKFTLQCS